MESLTKSYYALGTEINLTIYPPASEEMLEAGYELIQDYENKLTVNRFQSEVMAINYLAGDQPVVVSDISYKVIKKAVEISQMNLGFNALIGPLVQLWHIGFNDASVPSDAAIQEALKCIDPTHVYLNDKTRAVFLSQPGMQLDLGAIAKGYIADAIADLWKQHDVKQGIIDLGGNLLLVGSSARSDGLWHIGIQNPEKERDIPLGFLTTPAKSIVTSGIYERFLKSGDHFYHHILDPKTGYPVATSLASVTIISDQSITGELWSTIAFYQGIENIKTRLPKNIQAIFATQAKEIYLSSTLAPHFKLLDSNYTLHFF